MPASWRPAKRRQKDVDATWTKKHGKSHFGYKLSINIDRKHKIIRRIDGSKNKNRNLKIETVKTRAQGQSCCS